MNIAIYLFIFLSALMLAVGLTVYWIIKLHRAMSDSVFVNLVADVAINMAIAGFGLGAYFGVTDKAEGIVAGAVWFIVCLKTALIFRRRGLDLDRREK